MDLRIRVLRAVSIAALASGLAACGDEDTGGMSGGTAEAATAENRAPVITGKPGVMVVENELYEFVAAASDPDGDPIVFGIDGKPAWLEFDTGSGRLWGTPRAADVGMHRGIVIWASDGAMESLLPTTDIEVRAAASAGNRAPEISGSPSPTATVGRFYDFIPAASDGDGDALSFTIENRPVWATFDTDIGRLSGTPGAGAVGSYGNIVIRVDDGTSVTALDPFVIVVNPPPMQNSAPVIGGQPPADVFVDGAYSFTPVASDADGDPLVFSVINRPGWADFDSVLGTLSGVPAAADAGTYTGISIVVSDGTAASALVSFSIEVISPNRAPSIGGNPDEAVLVGNDYAFVPTADDPDGDPLAFSVSGLPSWAVFDPVSGALAGTPDAADVGTYNVSITVTDGEASTMLGPFPVEVVPLASGTATLTWNPPTAKTDGSPLADLSGFVIYWGTTSRNYSHSVRLENAGLSSYVVENLLWGETYYFAATAYDSVGMESAFSNETSRTIQ